MSDNWLEIGDENVSVDEIKRQIRERIAGRGIVSSPGIVGDPAAIATELWKEMIGDPAGVTASERGVPLRQQDCDIVPRHYVIDWRTPVLGPIHAMVRRIINAEICRYLLPSLEKQSHYNREVLRLLEDLVRENARLQRKIEALRSIQEQDN